MRHYDCALGLGQRRNFLCLDWAKLPRLGPYFSILLYEVYYHKISTNCPRLRRVNSTINLIL
jgi:hypothetical protein